jgi:hypothetical protein
MQRRENPFFPSAMHGEGLGEGILLVNALNQRPRNGAFFIGQLPSPLTPLPTAEYS